MDTTSIWAKTAVKWPSSGVARTEIKEFTGGAYSEKYLANKDSSGEGPEGRIRCGRKIIYPLDSLVKWLEDRSQKVERRES